MARIFLATLAALALAGCVSWIAPLSDKQVDRHHGTRTLGSKIEDAAIERKVWLNIVRGEPATQEARLVVTSWNGQVLLAGQVPTDAVKQRVEAIAGQVRHVLHVHNELEVGTPIAFITRMSDGWITTRVKTRLLFGPDVPGRRVKVVTENGVVYLLGLLTREEAELVVSAARAVYGVQKIVKIFEYIAADKADR
ncbi:MAG: BON domain-containing protein [Pseudomonadota bacterium]